MINRKIISFLVVISIIIQVISVTTLKAEEVSDTDSDYYTYAKKLSEIGVFKGTDFGFELNREPTRIEALVILIRLLGKEEEAIAMNEDESLFTDVPSWAIGYVNYGYKEGLTFGISDTEFGSLDPIESKSFTTFVLRSLGYNDSGDEAERDFNWSDANDFAKQIGLIDESLFNEMVNDEFLRNQVAKLAYNALVTDMKVMNKSDLKTLGQHLVDLGNIDVVRARSIEIVRPEEKLIEEVKETINSQSANNGGSLDSPSVNETKDNQPSNGTAAGQNEEEIIEPVEEVVETYTPLLGEASVSKEVLAAWARNKGMSQEGIDLIDIYYELCQEKGLNPVIQYIQMCLETGWLYKVASTAGIDASYHNPCGLKTNVGGDDYVASEFTSFDSWYEGIDAHTDHSALYAGVSGYPRADTKDPRHFSYLFGRVTSVEGLSGSWAEAGYHYKLLALYDDLLGL